MAVFLWCTMIDDEDSEEESEDLLALNVINEEMMPIQLDGRALHLQRLGITTIGGIRAMVLISTLPEHVSAALFMMRHVFLVLLHEMSIHAPVRNRCRYFDKAYADAHDQIESAGVYVFGAQDICIAKKSITGARINNFHNGMLSNYFWLDISWPKIRECCLVFFGWQVGSAGEIIDGCLQEAAMRGVSLVRLYLEMEKIFISKCTANEEQLGDTGITGNSSPVISALRLYPSAFDVLRNTKW